MNRFGMPLVPSALALWAINFIDRLFVGRYKGKAEVGVYSLAVSASSVIMFVMIAFRPRGPPSPTRSRTIRGRSARTRSCSRICSSSAAGSARARRARAVAREDPRAASPRSSAPTRRSALLAFAASAYAGYTVLAIGIGRARRTQFNWVVTGVAAVVNIALNFGLIPPLRDDRRSDLDARGVRRRCSSG